VGSAGRLWHDAVIVRPLPIAVLAASVLALLAGPAQGQGGGTPVPGPGDPCPATYPGDDAGRSSVALWMARGAALRDLPEALPVMAGLAESGLRNLRTPGAAYAGFFGMHRTLNKGPYRGFRRDPDLQLRWFTDTAVLVRQRERAEGDADYGADPARYGEWIADVERPAPENRDGYQPYLDDSGDLLSRPCRPADHVPDTQPPPLRVKAARRQRDAILVRVRCPAEACMAAASAEPRRRVRRARAVEVGTDAITLTLPARSRRGARLVVTVIAVDLSGNATSVEKRVTLLR